MAGRSYHKCVEMYPVRSKVNEMLSYMKVEGQIRKCWKLALAYDVYLAVCFAHRPITECCLPLHCIILNSRGRKGNSPFPGISFMFKNSKKYFKVQLAYLRGRDYRVLCLPCRVTGRITGVGNTYLCSEHSRKKIFV